MADKMATAEMIGEGLRELGILTFVFIPLDYVFSENTLAWGWVGVAMVMFGCGLFLLESSSSVDGGKLESKRWN